MFIAQTCLKLGSPRQTQGVVGAALNRWHELRVQCAASASRSSAEAASWVLSTSPESWIAHVGRANSSTWHLCSNVLFESPQRHLDIHILSQLFQIHFSLKTVCWYIHSQNNLRTLRWLSDELGTAILDGTDMLVCLQAMQIWMSLMLLEWVPKETEKIVFLLYDLRDCGQFWNIFQHLPFSLLSGKFGKSQHNNQTFVRLMQFHSGWPSLTTSAAVFKFRVVIVNCGSFVTTNNQTNIRQFLRLQTSQFKLHLQHLWHLE